MASRNKRIGRICAKIHREELCPETGQAFLEDQAFIADISGEITN